MKCRNIIFSILSLFSLQAVQAEPTRTIFNPFTGKFDYITRIDSNTIIPGTNVTITSSSGTVTINSSGGGGGGPTTLPLPAGATNYIQNTDSLQSGATFYVSSGTAGNFTAISPMNVNINGIGVVSDLIDFQQNGLTTSYLGRDMYQGVCSDLSTLCLSNALRYGDRNDTTLFAVDGLNGKLTVGLGATNNAYSSVISSSLIVGIGGYTDTQRIGDGNTWIQHGLSASTMTIRGLINQSCIGTNGTGDFQTGTCGSGSGASGPNNSVQYTTDSVHFLGNANFTTDGSSITVSTIVVNGGGAGEGDLVEGAAPSGIASNIVVWGDLTANWLKFNPNNSQNYLVPGSSSTNTAGHLATWSGAGSLIDGGTNVSGTPGGVSFNVQYASAGALTGASGFDVNPSSVVVAQPFQLITTTFTSLSSTTLNAQGGASTTIYASTFTASGMFVTIVATPTLPAALAVSTATGGSYYLSVDSSGLITANNLYGASLAACGDSTHALKWSGGQFGCQNVTGSGGGNSSTLAVGIGSGSWTNQISSPTAAISMDQSQFNGQLTGGSTAFLTIAYSSNPITGNYTTVSTDTVIVANCASACTVTVSTPVFSGKVLMIVQAGAGNVTISPNAGTIDGGSTVLMNQQYSELDIIFDGKNYWVK